MAAGARNASSLPLGAQALRSLAGAAARRGDARAAELLHALSRQAERLGPTQPHVTLGVVLLLAAVHFRSLLLPELAHTVPHDALLQACCVLPSRVLSAPRPEALRRLLLAPLLHGDDLHLYYNLGSFFVKGAQLEPRIGSAAFLSLVATLAVFASVIHVALSAAVALSAPRLARLAEYDACAIGFSTVLFGLKLLLTIDAPGTSRLAGYTIPTRLLSWGELVLIQVTNESISFMGHLAGILAGLLVHFVVTPALRRATGGWHAQQRRAEHGAWRLLRDVAREAGRGVAWLARAALEDHEATRQPRRGR